VLNRDKMQILKMENGIHLGFDELISSIQQLDNQSLVKFSENINQIILKRSNKYSDTNESELVKKINSTIPASVKRRQKQLYAGLQENSLTQKEYEELQLLNGMLEQKSAERILLMGQLAAQKGITLQQLNNQM
jgi:hypothetical protein